MRLILDGKDWGYLFSKFEYKVEANLGYVVRARVIDNNFVLLSSLIERGYFRKARSGAVFKLRFQILSGNDGEYPETATREQLAHVVSMRAWGDRADRAIIEFTAIDPPSWYLNAGDGAGRSYRGRVSQVIRQVVQDYAPNVRVDVSETTDSPQNSWSMMRQDPKSFISSLLEWSTSLTQRKTRWLVTMNGEELRVREQGQITSVQRAYYRYWGGGVVPITGWELVADNALHLVDAQLVTQGMSATSGAYYDRTTDRGRRIVFVNDATTANKKVPKVDQDESFSKPPTSGPPLSGWTSVPAVPELFSGGELGKPYRDYIDGVPRGMYLGLNDQLMRLRLRVLGHGEWSDGHGLGADTVFLRWYAANDARGGDRWFKSGNWLVHGFHHVVQRGSWATWLSLSRSDYDALGEQVGGGAE